MSQRRILLPQGVEHLVKRGDVRETAVARAMVVTFTVAVQPQVVVPLQVVGLNLVDECREAIQDPLPPGLPRQADLRRVVRLIAAVGRAQRRFARAPSSLQDERFTRSGSTQMPNFIPQP